MGIIESFILFSGHRWSSLSYSHVWLLHFTLVSAQTWHQAGFFLPASKKLCPPAQPTPFLPNLSLSLPRISSCVAPLTVWKPPEDLFSCYLCLSHRTDAHKSRYLFVKWARIAWDREGTWKEIREEGIPECKHHRLEDVPPCSPDTAMPGNPGEG